MLMPGALQAILWTASALLRLPATVDKTMEQPNVGRTITSPDPGMVWLMPAPTAALTVQLCAVKHTNSVITFKSSQ